MNYYHDDELYHYGVKGMKWGVRKKISDKVSNYRAKRKAKEEAYRNKLRNIRNSRHTSHDVKKRARYRNQSLTGRVVGQGIAAIAGTMVSELIKGNTERYRYMDKKQLQQHFTKLAASTAVRTASGVVINDALAKSAASRYNDDGSYRKDAKKQGFMSKEQKIERAIRLATFITPVIAKSAAMDMRRVRAEKAANEARFNSWGGRILNQSLDNYVYGNYEVV